MQNKDLIISIIIPVYNVEKYLRACLDSVLSQSFKQYEIICVNDASTDSSYEILKEYAAQHSTIRIIDNEKNEGLSYTRNRGIEAACGKYILFVDSDDMLKEDALSTLYRRVEKEDLDMLHFNFKVVYDVDWRSAEWDKEFEDCAEFSDIYTGKQFFTECWKYNNYPKIWAAWCWLYSRSFLMKYDLKFYNKIVNEDVLFSFMAMMKAKKIAHITDQLYIYQIRNNSLGTTWTVNHLHSMFIIFVEIMNYWKNNTFTEEENEAIKDWVLLILGWLRDYSHCIKDDAVLPYGTAADKFLYEIIQADRLEVHKYIKFSDEKKRIIKNAGSVIIYGAGDAGEECYWHLDKEEIKIKAFAVSSMEGNLQRLHQLDVVQVDSIEVDKDDLFIVAVSKQYQSDIVSKLNSLGYKNVLLPD